MMRITITGSSGFAGTNLIQYLKDFAFQKLSLRFQENQNINVGNSEAIIHLAGKAHDLKNVSKPQDYYGANFELTKQLYDAFLKSDAQKFIFISSVKAAADSVDGTLTEDAMPNPQTHYGKSKLMAEEYIKAQPLPEGKAYYILRPCIIHGPGNKGNLNLLYQFVKRGVPYPLAAFENRRSFLSIENLCFVIKQLIEKNIPSGVYNLADDEALSTNEVVKILADSVGRKVRFWRVPTTFVTFLAKIGDRFYLPLNSERLRKLTENYIVSNKKITEVLNTPLPIKSKEGLFATANSFNELKKKR